MTETDDELERLRKQKLEELAEQAETTSEEEPIHVATVEEFKDRIGNDPVVLVDFYADWCGPCQMLEPTVESVAESTHATVLKVDIDQHQSLAQQFGVRGVPTLLLFVDGQPDERLVGVQDEQTLVDLIERA